MPAALSNGEGDLEFKEGVGRRTGATSANTGEKPVANPPEIIAIFLRQRQDALLARFWSRWRVRLPLEWRVAS